MIDVSLGTMTMGISPILSWALKNSHSGFKKIMIFDGARTQKSEDFYKSFKNVEYINLPWDDLYVKRYKKFGDSLAEGEWGLWLDDDEVCSKELLLFLETNKYKEGSFNTYQLPCVLHLSENEKNYYPCETKPALSFQNQWTKHIFFRKENTLFFRAAGSHVIPTHGIREMRKYVPFPYYHLKSLQSFAENDIYQGFLCPEAQGFELADAKLFSLLTKQYKNTIEFKQATLQNKWTNALQKFAWERRWRVNNPISRLAWTYWILNNHPRPETDDLLTWNNIKKYIQGEDKMKFYEENKRQGKGIII